MERYSQCVRHAFVSIFFEKIFGAIGIRNIFFTHVLIFFTSCDKMNASDIVNRLLKYSSDNKMSCDISTFTGRMNSVDVLKEQMNDMLKGNTRKAYQLASSKNRESTADHYNQDRFDRMIRSPKYAPLLQAKDYSYTNTNKSDCQETFDVLLYDKDVSVPTHGYEFLLSRQIHEDLDESLQAYKLPVDSQYWRTDHVLPILPKDLQSKHNDMMRKRQESLRKACFNDAYNHHSVQHSFGEDMTHNLCCHLGGKAHEYSNASGNPIGRAARNINSENWSTCMGSNVCTFYAQTQKDGTKPLFATSPDLYKLSTYIPSNMNCEAFAAEELSMTSHGTPGILTKGESSLCSLSERKQIQNNIHTSHKKIQSIIEDMLD
tara:strand:- start:280 stop:1404 length:1125 start_codon:yes stop_codon:yes gene_type:complete